MKVLGIDFGLIHFGLAITEGNLVEPLGQLSVKDSQKQPASSPSGSYISSRKNLQQIINKLQSICRKNHITKIIIGLPEGKLKKTVIGFSQKLEQKTGLPIVFQPEDFTSKEALKKMIEAGKPMKKRQKQRHVIAACLILQEYLDTMKQV